MPKSSKSPKSNNPSALPARERIARPVAALLIAAAAAMLTKETQAEFPPAAWLLFAFLATVVFFAISYLPPFATHRAKKIAVFASSVAAVLFLCGHSLEREHSIGWHLAHSGQMLPHLLILGGGFSACFLLLRGLFGWLERPARTFRSAKPLGCGRGLFAPWGGIFLCWLPFWLAFFPAYVSYDRAFISRNVLEGKFNAFQSVIYSKFLSFCVHIAGIQTGGSLADLPAAGVAKTNLAFGLFIGIQMLVMSFLCAFALHLLRKQAVPRVLWWVAAGWFALNPLFGFFSMTFTKDGFFTAFFLVYVLLLWQTVRRLSKKTPTPAYALILGGTLALLCCLLRNNFSYVLIGLLLLGVLIFRKQWLKLLPSLVCVMLLPVLAAAVVTGPIYRAAHIETNYNERESLSVPLMQLGRVYEAHKGYPCESPRPSPQAPTGLPDYHLALTDDELQSLETLLLVPGKDWEIRLRFADKVKQKLSPQQIIEHRAEMWKTWRTLGMKYPGLYVDAFAELNLGSWYPGVNFPDVDYGNWCYIAGEFRGDTGQADVYRVFNYQPIDQTPLHILQKPYNSFKGGAVLNVPVIGLLFHPAMPIWLMAACALACWLCRKPQWLLPLLPGALVWGTNLLGPVADVRYALPLMICYPIFIITLFGLREAEATKQKDTPRLPGKNRRSKGN